MLRVIVVLPLYLAAMYFIPTLGLYRQFANWIESGESSLQLHLAGYASALIVAVVVAFMIEPRTQSYRYGALFRVLRLGLVGVVVTSAYQLYCFLTSQPLSVLTLFTPAIFMVAEIIYELVEHVLDRSRT